MHKRLFRIGESNINSVMDQLEDPIKMTEQGIRDLEKDLTAAMVNLDRSRLLPSKPERMQRQNTRWQQTMKTRQRNCSIPYICNRINIGVELNFCNYLLL
ncbi:PspA/IM30 family protein [Desulforapulum autotrophicum]|uniref:PspA/IM30 family protein n=1 Tax=Desulforapulum autotrophicum TaxID=2296 RepID=UPI00059C17FE|nr:PspA/IM30 family protein [Desulforapulum autotrophicum]